MQETFLRKDKKKGRVCEEIYDATFEVTTHNLINYADLGFWSKRSSTEVAYPVATSQARR